MVKVLLRGDIRAPLESDVFKYGSVSDDEVRVRMNPTRDVTAERLCVGVFIRIGERVEAAASIIFSCDETPRERLSTRWEDMDDMMRIGRFDVELKLGARLCNT